MYRVLKQAFYAGGCVLFLVFIFAIILYPLLWPGDDKLVPLPQPSMLYQPVQLEKVSIIRHERGVDVVALLRNPNSHAGVPEYDVTFVLRNTANQELHRVTQRSYLLPGAVQYLAAINVLLPLPISSFHHVDVVLPDTPTFSQVPAAVSLPRFSSFPRSRMIRSIGTDKIEEQTGAVRNTSNFDWERVEIIGVAVSARGTVVGVGQTFIGRLTVGELREFTLQWPSPTEPTAQVILMPTTNIYIEENIIDIIGDPSRLR